MSCAPPARRFYHAAAEVIGGVGAGEGNRGAHPAAKSAARVGVSLMSSSVAWQAVGTLALALAFLLGTRDIT